MQLIGNRSVFAIELVPVSPSWDVRYAPERAGWAGVALWVDDANLCRHIVPGSSEVQEYLFIPLAPIADWLVRSFPAIEFQERAALFPTNRHLHDSVSRWGKSPPALDIGEDQWFDQREEWWLSHFLRAGADGARVPNVAFARDDEDLVVDWDAPRFFGSGAPVMLTPRGNYSLPWDDGVAVLDRFAAQVAEWIRGTDAAAVFPWARERQPLLDARPPVERSIELYTGRTLRELAALLNVTDADELTTTLRTVSSTEDPAALPEYQVLRDLSPRLPDGIGNVLRELSSESTRVNAEALARWMRGRSVALDASRPAEAPTEAGYLAADEIRNIVSLDGAPIDDVDDVARRLGVSIVHLQFDGGHDRMVVGAREEGSAVARTLLTDRTSTRWGRRFEAARALGHALLDPVRGHALGAASGPYAQETRRQRSGAFAAELLLPVSAMANASGNELDGAATDRAFARIMHQYGVGARTAAFQLWNHGWLSSPELRDELIDRYAVVSE